MKILIVNTSERTGGAAVAANRLMKALNNSGVKAKMLVRDKESDTLTVAQLPKSPMKRWHFLWERLVVFCHLHFSKQHLFEIDIANAGTDITNMREFQEADIIHLHWINQGMLSLNSIRKILRSGKPVVWTMHDIWPATGICHYTRGCGYFKTACKQCQLLPGGGSANDLSTTIWNQKQKLLSEHHISFVACSKWLEGEAKKSALLQGQHICSVPNPIDTHIYHPEDKQQARQRLELPTDKRIILFVSQRVTDDRKGMAYFTDAINRLAEQHPEARENTVIAILGGHSEDVAPQLALPVYPLGYVNDEQRIVDVYNAADVFVLPSLEDNLPNTIMEAMACGVPCVGFRVGGIPEMIDHQKNGYVARF
ncbi:MAG: glycosyltransferase, partial [Prevotella sp.]|nr:glycosyltransferase [Prevotella sp.]